MLRQNRCGMLRQNRCGMLRQNRCGMLRQNRCGMLRQNRCGMLGHTSASNSCRSANARHNTIDYSDFVDCVPDLIVVRDGYRFQYCSRVFLLKTWGKAVDYNCSWSIIMVFFYNCYNPDFAIRFMFMDYLDN